MLLLMCFQTTVSIASDTHLCYTACINVQKECTFPADMLRHPLSNIITVYKKKHSSINGILALNATHLWGNLPLFTVITASLHRLQCLLTSELELILDSRSPLAPVTPRTLIK